MIDLQIDRAQLTKVADQVTRSYLKAGKESVAETTKWLERELEALTRSAVPGRLWRAWTSQVYPKGSAIARDPVGEIYLKGGTRTRGAMRFWSSPGRIQSKTEGGWLAFPTRQAGARGRGRDITPGEWERANGQRLRMIYRPGRPGLLVADGTTNGRTGAYRKITRKRTAADDRRGYVRGSQSVIIFVLMPSVDFRNAFAVQPKIDQARSRLGSEFVARAGRIG